MNRVKSLSLNEKLKLAWNVREPLFALCEQEDTNCYRLFHGTVEGLPGVTVDRYGSEYLIQSFHQPLADEQQRQIRSFYNDKCGEAPFWIYNDRSDRTSRRQRQPGELEDLSRELTAKELGVTYRVSARHEGEDPLLFLDLRVARRWLLHHSAGKSVLNLFGYTCGAGVCASVAGATHVLNVDFSRFALAFAAENYRLNRIPEDHFTLLESDCFAALKQLAGIPFKPRFKKLRNGRRVPVPLPDYPALQPQTFDLVFLDPPRWAKSPFGTVDLIRDYQSLFKPALQVTAQGGTLVACNNVAKVALDDWLAQLQRCAEKAGRPIREIEVIRPDADFPSPDNKPPLKVAVCYL